jgi:hypothetical protein
MADQFFTLKGLDAFIAKMAELPKALARKALRPSLLAGAYVAQKATVEAAPRLAKPVYRKGKLIRTPGLLKSRIKVRTSKEATREGNIGVFVNVKPAAPGERGKYSPLDPFYWKFVTFRTKKNSGSASGYVPFMQIGARKLEGEAFDAIKRDLEPRIQEFNNGGNAP